jgi:hypothetical protein
MFLYDIEHKIIDIIVNAHPDFDQLYSRINMIFDRFYSRILIEQQLKTVLENALKCYDHNPQKDITDTSPYNEDYETY